MVVGDSHEWIRWTCCHHGMDPSPPKHTLSFLPLLSSPGAGALQIGWAGVPRYPVTRELVPEVSGVAQAIPALD